MKLKSCAPVFQCQKGRIAVLDFRHRNQMGHHFSRCWQEQVRAVAQERNILGGAPPPLQTTTPQRKEEDKSGSFGLVPQVVVGVISLALVGVLVLTSIGDSPAPPSKQVQLSCLSFTP